MDKDYLSGKCLYGDDHNSSEIEQWFNDESEAYADLVKNIYHHETGGYSWHGLNLRYGYPQLDKKSISHILGFGSAAGAEFIPLLHSMDKSQISDFIILEPSDSFIQSAICDVPVHYIKPKMSGILDFPNDYFNLITCFGVLHHIPNISTIMTEFSRCLALNGMILIREPIISMGDWRFPRIGLTKHERGIPINIFRDIIKSVNLQIKSENICVFALSDRILRIFFKSGVFNSINGVIIDSLFCAITKWNMRYHATSPFHKIRPTCVYYVLTKCNP